MKVSVEKIAVHKNSSRWMDIKSLSDFYWGYRFVNGYLIVIFYRKDIEAGTSEGSINIHTPDGTLTKYRVNNASLGGIKGIASRLLEMTKDGLGVDIGKDENILMECKICGKELRLRDMKFRITEKIIREGYPGKFQDKDSYKELIHIECGSCESILWSAGRNSIAFKNLSELKKIIKQLSK